MKHATEMPFRSITDKQFTEKMRPDQGLAHKYVSDWQFRSDAWTTWHTLVKFNPTLSPTFELDFSDLLRTHLKVNAIACDLRSHHPDIGGHIHLRTHTRDYIKSKNKKNVTLFQGPFVAFQTFYFKWGPGEIGYFAARYAYLWSLAHL